MYDISIKYMFNPYIPNIADCYFMTLHIAEFYYYL